MIHDNKILSLGAVGAGLYSASSPPTAAARESGDLFRKVIFPSAIPSIVAGARLGVKASLFSVIAAEMLAARSGIGFLIQNSQLMLQSANMYAGIITLTIVGLSLNYALVEMERRATHWRATTDPQPH